MKLHAIGIDLGKTVLHLVGLDQRGKVTVRKRCQAPSFCTYCNLQADLIGMEACRRSLPREGPP